MNPTPNMSGLPVGRAKLFDEKLALTILDYRQLGGVSTVKRFCEQMVEEGILTKPCSVSTMHKLLSGRMYPDLIDPKTGVVFDWAALPHAPSGYQHEEELDVDGELPTETEKKEPKKRKLNLPRQRMFEQILNALKDHVRRHPIYDLNVLMQDRDRHIKDLYKRNAELEERVKALEVAAGAG